jgi:hypothetical protein
MSREILKQKEAENCTWMFPECMPLLYNIFSLPEV